MVTIKWTGGRTGNDLFSYNFARLLALQNNLHLATEWPHPDFIEMHPFVGGEKNDKPVVIIRDLYKDDHNKPWFNTSLTNKHLIIHGFFQFPGYFDKNKKLVKSFLKLPPVEKRPPEHIVMHWRLTDYYQVGKGGSVIHPTWYAGILKHKLRWNPKKHKLFIVTDDPKDKILNKLSLFRPTIVSESPKHDFNFIRSFDTILCGNSSFSWWASYLSEAKRIFTFSRWINEPHGHIIRLAFFHGALPVQGNWYR